MKSFCIHHLKCPCHWNVRVGNLLLSSHPVLNILATSRVVIIPCFYLVSFWRDLVSASNKEQYSGLGAILTTPSSIFCPHPIAVHEYFLLTAKYIILFITHLLIGDHNTNQDREVIQREKKSMKSFNKYCV